MFIESTPILSSEKCVEKNSLDFRHSFQYNKLSQIFLLSNYAKRSEKCYAIYSKMF